MSANGGGLFTNTFSQKVREILVDLCLMTISMDGSRALEITCKIAQALPPTNQSARSWLEAFSTTPLLRMGLPNAKTEILRNYLIPSATNRPRRTRQPPLVPAHSKPALRANQRRRRTLFTHERYPVLRCHLHRPGSHLEPQT